MWWSASQRFAQISSRKSLKTYYYNTKACKCTVARIPNEGGEVDRALRPGLAALRVAGYPAVCVCERGQMPVYNIFTPLVTLMTTVYQSALTKLNQCQSSIVLLNSSRTFCEI